jgi:hypothetical protein
MPIPPLSPYEEITKKEAEELGLTDADMEEFRLKVVETPADPVDPSKPISTTAESIYFSGDTGEEMKEKQEEVDKEMFKINAARFAGLGGFAPVPEDIKEKKEELDAYKGKRYEEIKGDNVEEYPLLGKVIVNPNGTKNYVPSPDETGLSLVPKKATLDMARGLLSVPELWGGKNYKDLVPQASSEDEAVLAMSEITQLGIGAMSGVGAISYLSKLAKLKNYVPALWQVLTEGTAGSAIGSAAVATEETNTLVDDVELAQDINPFDTKEGKADAAAKFNILVETVTLGAAAKLVTSAGSKIGLGEIPKAVGILFAGKDKLRDDTITEMGRQLNVTKRLTEEGASIEDIEAARVKLNTLVDKAMVEKTGMTIEEFLVKQAEGKIGTDVYVPVPGELLSDTLLMGMYRSAKNAAGSGTEALELLAKSLVNIDQQRLYAIQKQAEKIDATLTPRGLDAATEARDMAAEQLPAERAAIEQARDVATEQATAARTANVAEAQGIAGQRAAELSRQTEEAMGVSRQAVTDAQRAEEVARAGARTEVDTAARKLSPDELAAEMDPRAMVKPVDDRLRSMVETKNSLADTMKTQLDTISLDMEETKELYDSLLAQAKNAAKLHAGEDAMKAAYKPLERFIGAVKARVPEENEELQALLQRVQDGIEDGGEYFATLGEIDKLLNVGDLPAITAKDLLDIRTGTSAAASGYKKMSIEGGPDAAMFNDMGQYLRDTASILDSKVSELAQRNPEAVKAKAAFDDYYKNTFAESWRTGTGREYQEELFSAMTEADRVKVANQMLDTMVNPKAKPEEQVFIRNVVEGMDPEQKDLFIQSVQPRIVSGFSNRDTIQRLLLSDRDPVEVAGALAKELEVYLSGTKQYFDVMPGADTRLQELLTQLKSVSTKAGADIGTAQATVARETAAQKALAKAEATGQKQISSEAGVQVKIAMDDAKQAIAAATQTFSDANRILNNSALATITSKETTAGGWFKAQLANDTDGFQQVNDLWQRAAKTPVDPMTGLPRGQQAIKEAVTEALWKGEKGVYRNTKDMTGKSNPNIALLQDATGRKGTPSNQIINLVFQDDPNGKEILTRFANVAKSRAIVDSVPGSIGSKTADVEGAKVVLSGVNTIIYGPLSHKGTIIRTLTGLILKFGDTQKNLADIQADVLSNPKYTKMIIDRAAEMEKEALMGADDALGAAFFATMMVSLGYREYEKVSDPYTLAEQEIRSMTLGTETEEAFSQ